jgi:hypothetical protein
LQATYEGDASNAESSGTFSLTVNPATAPCSPVTTLPADVSAEDTCTGTPFDGTLTAVSTDTGITVSITGTSATGSVTITTSDETGAPPSGADVSLGAGTAYYDVEVSGATDGTALVCISPAAPTMQYYDPSTLTWVSASNIVVTSTQICGDIPVSALTGTVIAIGTPTTSAGVPEFPSGSGLAAAAIGFLALIALMRGRAPRKPAPA